MSARGPMIYNGQESAYVSIPCPTLVALTMPNNVARGGSERCSRFRIISEKSAYKIRKKDRNT